VGEEEEEEEEERVAVCSTKPLQSKAVRATNTEVPKVPLMKKEDAVTLR
jgi:hypothetical protein